MKILLISPTSSANFYQSKVRVSPPFGLFRLKKWIENKSDESVKVDILDTSLSNYLEYDYRPYDIIGVGCTHPTLEKDLGVLHWIKQKSPKSTLVAGGIEATFVPEIFTENSPVDLIIKGEGEKQFVELINKGKITAERDDLNDEEYREANLAVDFKEMNWDKYWALNQKNFGDKEKYIRIPSDVNYCPRKCIFCSSTNFFNNLKYLEAEDLIEITKKVSELNPDVILFQSDNFLIGRGRERLFKLANELNFHSDIPLMVQTGVPDIDQETTAALKKIGVKKVSMGVESFSPNILKEFMKKQNEELDHKVLNILLDNNMKVFSNIILTSPGAKMEDVAYTIDKIDEYLKKGVDFGINLVPLKLPGSALYNMDVGVHITEKVEIPHSGGKILEKAGKVYPSDKVLREKTIFIENKLKAVKASSENLSKLIVESFKE